MNKRKCERCRIERDLFLLVQAKILEQPKGVSYKLNTLCVPCLLREIGVAEIYGRSTCSYEKAMKAKELKE